jgi:hypothetical protein
MTSEQARLRRSADPNAAARKLVEIANTVEAVLDGRIHIEPINGPFMEAGGTSAEYRAGLDHQGLVIAARVRGLREVHSGGGRAVHLMPWSSPCHDPIQPPKGKPLLTLTTGQGAEPTASAAPGPIAVRSLRRTTSWADVAPRLISSRAESLVVGILRNRSMAAGTSQPNREWEGTLL